MAETERLHWANARRKLGDLQPQEDNPRQIDVESAERLKTSWAEYDQVDVLAVGPDGAIYNGHQRYYVLLDERGPDFEVDVRIASRSLTKREWQRLTVLMHEGAVGEWDFDGLANWDGVDVGDLTDWGFDAWKFGMGQDEKVDHDALWHGMPEFEQEGLEPYRRLTVYFASKDDVQTFSKLLGQAFSDKAKYIWHPKQIRADFHSTTYQDES